MKYILVGDIHGKVDQVKRALDMEGKKIFVGDFIDSFDRSLDDHRKCYDLVLWAIKDGEAEAIFGNHELSYLMHNIHGCSGWDQGRAEVVMEFQEDLNKYFKPFLMLTPTFLVTHAGLSKHIWRDRPIKEIPETLTKWWDNGPHGNPIHGIGRTRGGLAKAGGIFWCHFPHEFEPIPGLTQVFGHTAGRDIRRMEDSYCIDCLDHKHEFLEMEV